MYSKVYAEIGEKIIFPTMELLGIDKKIINPDSNEVRKDSDRESQSTDSKIAHAPLTNLGCESELAKLDNRIKTCGGTTSIQTISRKNVVTNNAYLLSSDNFGFTYK